MPVPLRDEEMQSHLEVFGARQLRCERGLTQERLAEAADLHRTIVGFIERGEREVGVSKVWPIATALGVQVADLFANV